MAKLQSKSQKQRARVTSGIHGISRTSLWKAWKEIRRDIRRIANRDVVDFLEYDIDPDTWINLLLRSVADGVYEPETPKRFTLGKSGGISRYMTLPTIPDAVLYRCITSYLYDRAKRWEAPHSYFERSALGAAQKAILEKKPIRIWKWLEPWNYEPMSKKGFRAWLAFDQYRKYLLLKRVYRYIVVSDVTNFFDSILYAKVSESLHRISAPPRMVGLLFFILERFSIRDAYNESPRIGLPVDEFGCSRRIAHMVLFPHDDRMIHELGERNFIRFMDDQNFGVNSRAEGLQMMGLLSRSLAQLHLTSNPLKSKILSISEARRHFHFDINRLLDDADDMPRSEHKDRAELRKKVNEIWSRAKKLDGQGEWSKILKRLYRHAMHCGSRRFRRRARSDILQSPGLAQRVFAYMRVTGSVAEYLDFIEDLLHDDEQVYPDATRFAFESLLRLEPSGEELIRVRRLVSTTLRGRLRAVGAEHCQPVATLGLLRFGDRRSLPSLESCLNNPTSSSELVRACAIVLSGYGPADTRQVRRIAARLLRNHLSHVVRLIDVIQRYRELPGRFHPRVKLEYDDGLQGKFIDMRALVTIRLLGLNRTALLRKWIADKRQEFLAEDLSQFDVKLLKRLWPR